MTQMRKHADPVQDIINRRALVAQWQDRLDKIDEINGTNPTSFCRKNGFYLEWLSRAKNMKPLPTWKKIRDVEAALKKEESKFPKENDLSGSSEL